MKASDKFKALKIISDYPDAQCSFNVRVDERHRPYDIVLNYTYSPFLIKTLVEEGYDLVVIEKGVAVCKF